MPSVMHIELLKLRDGIDEARLYEMIVAARTDVPELIEVHFGRTNQTVTGTADSTHAICSRLARAVSMESLQSHPRIEELKTYINSFSERPPIVLSFPTNGYCHL